MVSKEKGNYKSLLKSLMENVLKVFHLALFHSHNHIGAACLCNYHHKTREEIRKYVKNLNEEEDVFKEQAVQFHDLIKLCYESFSRGDITGAKTYFYHMKGVFENFGTKEYKLKLPI